jgi:protein-S-isoprenylcysteine O-methyltransferase Ste14
VRNEQGTRSSLVSSRLVRPLSNPLVHVLAFITIAVWIIAEIRQSQNRREDATASDRGSRTVLGVTRVFGAVLAIVFYRQTGAARIGPALTVGWVALVCLWCGIALRFWSFRTLGRYFTFTVQTSEDQPVIDSGPYKVIRHPSYAGALLAIAGVALLFGNWWSFAGLMVPVVAGFVYRIVVEERSLKRALGERYVDYARTHKRLVPFLW